MTWAPGTVVPSTVKTLVLVSRGGFTVMASDAEPVSAEMSDPSAVSPLSGSSPESVPSPEEPETAGRPVSPVSARDLITR